MERIEWVEMTMLTNSRRRTTVTSVQPPVSCGRVAVDDSSSPLHEGVTDEHEVASS